jgi:hypothetical protein
MSGGTRLQFRGERSERATAVVEDLKVPEEELPAAMMIPPHK